MLPYELSTQVQPVVGPATGGALLAHTLAGLLDGRRSLEHPPCMFAPFTTTPRKGCACGRPTPRLRGQEGPARRRCAEHGQDVEPLRRARAQGWWRGASRRRDLRPDGSGRRPRRPQLPLLEYPTRPKTTRPPTVRCAGPAADHEVLSPLGAKRRRNRRAEPHVPAPSSDRAGAACVTSTLHSIKFLFTAPLILLFLLVINLMTSPGHWWVQWPALGLRHRLVLQPAAAC